MIGRIVGQCEIMRDTCRGFWNEQVDGKKRPTSTLARGRLLRAFTFGSTPGPVRTLAWQAFGDYSPPGCLLQEVNMKSFTLALMAALVVMTAHAADATCVAQAAEKNLAGAAKTSFLNKCMRDAVAASSTSCDAQAAEKKLAGAAKISFTRKCIADATPDVQATCDSMADDKKLAGAARTSYVNKCVTDSVKQKP